MVQMEQSYIGQLGRIIEPAVKPLGFDWKMGASLLTGLSAKEIVVSTMGILYQGDGDVDEHSTSLQTSLQSQSYADGSPVFTPLVAYAFMIFILLYCPCIATITAISKEAGRRWAWIAVLYQIGVAWVASFLVFQIGGLLV